jgi:hypothetical protein
LLAKCVEDSHPKVRLAALRALSRLDPDVLLPVIPLIVRKCAEADAKIEAAAREAWERALTAPATEPLRPLRPYPGTNNVLGVQMTLDGLAPHHPLRQVSEALPLPPEGRTDATRLARHLAAVCARIFADRPSRETQ